MNDRERSKRQHPAYRGWEERQFNQIVANYYTEADEPQATPTSKPAP